MGSEPPWGRGPTRPSLRMRLLRSVSRGQRVLDAAVGERGAWGWVAAQRWPPARPSRQHGQGQAVSEREASCTGPRKPRPAGRGVPVGQAGPAVSRTGAAEASHVGLRATATERLDT